MSCEFKHLSNANLGFSLIALMLLISVLYLLHVLAYKVSSKSWTDQLNNDLYFMLKSIIIHIAIIINSIPGWWFTYILDIIKGVIKNVSTNPASFLTLTNKSFTHTNNS